VEPVEHDGVGETIQACQRFPVLVRDLQARCSLLLLHGPYREDFEELPGPFAIFVGSGVARRQRK